MCFDATLSNTLFIVLLLLPEGSDAQLSHDQTPAGPRSLQPLFQKELSRAIQALRDSAKAEAVHKQVEIMRDPGARKAADRKVQLEATREMLGNTAQYQSATNDCPLI